MNSLRLNQLLMHYFNSLAVLAEMLRQNAATLGLMAPGFAEQLAVDNGVGLAENGIPIFRAVVMKRRADIFRSQLEFGRAVQEALDEVCYQNCYDRLYLLRVDQLPGGYVGLTLTWGAW